MKTLWILRVLLVVSMMALDAWSFDRWGLIGIGAIIAGQIFILLYAAATAAAKKEE